MRNKRQRASVKSAEKAISRYDAKFFAFLTKRLKLKGSEKKGFKKRQK